MKNRLILFLGIIFLLLSACSQQDYDILIKQINIVDVKSGKILKNQNIGIASGHIQIISGNDLNSSPDNTIIIDGDGKFVIPGLCDSHTHLCLLTTTGGDTLKTELADFVRHGVLFIRDVGGPIDVMSKLKGQINSGELLGPDIYYTGPMLESSPLTWGEINKLLPGFTVPLDAKADVDSLLPVLAEKGATLIKTFNNINPELYPYIVEMARKNNLKIVHDPGTVFFNWVPIDIALEYGVTTFEHTNAPCSYVLKEAYRAEYNALRGPDANLKQQNEFKYKITNLGVEFISHERLNTLCNLMKDKKAVLCPTLRALKSLIKEIEDQEMKGESNTELTRSKEYLLSLIPIDAYIVRLFSENSVRLLVGQDSCEPEGTVEEMVLMSETGMSNIEVLRGATLYAAEWLEIADKYGSVERGKIADLVLLNADPLADIANVHDVYKVIQHGKLVRR